MLLCITAVLRVREVFPGSGKVLGTCQRKKATKAQTLRKTNPPLHSTVSTSIGIGGDPRLAFARKEVHGHGSTERISLYPATLMEFQLFQKLILTVCILSLQALYI